METDFKEFNTKADGLLDYVELYGTVCSMRRMCGGIIFHIQGPSLKVHWNQRHLWL